MEMDHADLLDASGAWVNEEDEASYRRWLDSIAVEEVYTEAQLAKLEQQDEEFRRVQPIR